MITLTTLSNMTGSSHVRNGHVAVATLAGVNGTAVYSTGGYMSVFNNGAMTGDIYLLNGGGSGCFTNTGSFSPGKSVTVGTCGVDNSGTINLSGTTSIAGNYRGSGKLLIDADFVGGASDRLAIDGDAVVGDTVTVNARTIRNAPIKIASATGSTTLDPALKMADNSHLYDFKATAVGKDLMVAPVVRLRQHSSRDGDRNWLLLPGGPGIGSESLQELADCLTVAGSLWLVVLPGDGSNPAPAGTAPFANWPHVVVDAARMLPNVVLAGHSTGGMYLLATPELERHLVGLVLIDTAPNASWHAHFVEVTLRHPLPAVDAAAAIYAADKCDASIAAIAVASAEWNFTPQGLVAGRELLSRMPYNSAAIEWSDAHFDHVYKAAR
ncbi:hypothetical protein [Sandarakinorhabdus sp. DWP1-3-1]|uniref:hypothetical protein n=1 Tax=Sandarakinorhabdus sp. DWP1-3-1 TaxID=2804627 RepID=UPI003CF09E52